MFSNRLCQITKCGQLTATGAFQNGLCILNKTKAGSKSKPEGTVAVSDLTKWDQRLAHVDEDSIRAMVRNGFVSGMSINPKQQLPICTGCVYCKSSRAPIPN